MNAPRAGGLTSAEVRRRLARFGRNALPETPRSPVWRRFLGQFRSPLIYILVFALAVDLGVWASDPREVPVEAIAIAVILALNAGLGVWQEWKAEGALARLAALAEPRVWTRRDGRMVEVPTAELVPDDLIRLEAGDRVPADVRVASGENLSLDESVLTGESFPVEKGPDDEAFAGTLAARGWGWFVVVRTGSASAMGRLAALVRRVKAEPTPLEAKLDAFGRTAAWSVLLLALSLAAGALLLGGTGHFRQVFLLSVALAVAAVPEGLPAVLTVTLALGVERMAKRKAVVRRLAAVEALGSVTVIATDKTGTLTENRLEAHDLVAEDRGAALLGAVLANDAEPGSDAGDPIDVALLRLAAREGLAVTAVRTAAPRRSSRPFEAASRSMRVTVIEAGREVTYLKGAPEVVLAACRLSAPAREALAREIEARAAEGYRLLALARGPGERDRDLDWLGFVVLWDPPRPEVQEAIRRARTAGIRVIIVTGDHPATARTVAGTLGLDADRVKTGDELQSIGPDELRRAVRRTDVFARVTAEHKLLIVEALQAEGEIVAMTGDGVNDAPALKRAQVGIAMGRRGTDVSRETADLVLLDDNFATIVAAVEEGRSIYENVQKFIRFLLSTNLSEVLVVTGGALAAFAFGLREADGSILLPLTAAQLLWINLATDGLPALALGLDRNPGVMERGPRDPAAALLDSPSRRFVALSAGAKAVLALGVLVALPRLFGQSVEATRTALFVFLAAGQLLFAYPARHTDVRPLPNRLLHVAIGVSLLAQAAVITVPGLMDALATVALPAAELVWVAGTVVASWALAHLTSRLVWRRS